MKRLLLYIVLTGLLPAHALAQKSNVWGSDTPIAASPIQEQCITTMTGFPDDGLVPRYQFFRLTQELAEGATPDFKSALDVFGDGDIRYDTPVIEVIEAIANPVLRQAAPELAIAHMKHLINFASTCEQYLNGQVHSLRAADPTLELEDPIISEDALYLRQVLSDSLFRLEADKDPIHRAAVEQYAASLVTVRDDLEYANFVVEIDDIEALYMTDLDGRLARSNDIINEEMDRNTLNDAVALSEDMNKSSNEQAKQNAVRTLLRILSRY